MEDQGSPTKWSLNTATHYTLIFLIVDNFLFNVVLNLVAINVAAIIGDSLHVKLLTQIFIMITVVVAAYLALFSLNLERGFWQLLFSSEERYRYILWIREFLNIISLGVFLYILFGWDIEISCARETFMTLLYNKVHPTFSPSDSCPCDIKDGVQKDQAVWWKRMIFWIHGPNQPPCAHPKEIANILQVFLAVAGVTGCVMKAMHFGTLESYLKAMTVFGHIHTEGKSSLSLSIREDKSLPNISEESVLDSDLNQPDSPGLLDVVSRPSLSNHKVTYDENGNPLL